MSEIKSGVKVEKEIPNPMQDNAEEVATSSALSCIGLGISFSTFTPDLISDILSSVLFY